MTDQGRQHDPELTADLLGYCLGLCDEQEKQNIEQALARQPDYAKSLASLEKMLATLSADDCPTVPEHLNDAILRRISQINRTIPMPTASANTETGAGSRPFFNLRELLSLAAVIAIFVGIFVPGYRTARNNAQRIACAGNLGQIGRSAAQYKELYGNTFPLAAALPDGVSWAPYSSPQSSITNNSQNAFQLVRRSLIPASVFNCPARDGDVVLDDPNDDKLAGFPDPRNNSYSTNLLPHSHQPQKFDPNSPIAADLTPLVDNNRRLVDDRPISLNSTSHGGMGQNVLKADLRVIFTRNPYAGLDNDDIYRVIGVKKYTGLERPQLRSDAFLIP